MLRMQRRSQQRKRIFTWGPIIAIVAIVVVLLTLSGSGSGKKKVATTDTTVTTAPETSTPPPSIVPVPEGAKITGDTPCPKADGSSPRTTTFAKPPPMCIDPTKTYTATMQTSQGGPITIALDPKQAPKTVNNFVFLARYHFYDGLTFHRIVPDFVIQGGDPKGNGSGDPGYKFADELPKAGQYKVGSLAMANSGPN